MNKHNHDVSSKSLLGESLVSVLIFCNYCIVSYIYICNLPIPGPFKKAVYLSFCRLLVKSIKRKQGKIATQEFKFASKFIDRSCKLHIFANRSQKIELNSENSPWSTIFPGCLLFVDQAIAGEIAELLPDKFSINNFWSDVLAEHPTFNTFFRCSHDIMFGPVCATRLHNFYCEGNNFLSGLVRKTVSLVCDFNSFLLIHQLHVHALVISSLSINGVGFDASMAYLRNININKTTGFGIGDIITGYPALNYYAPQVLKAHCSDRKELKALLYSWWGAPNFD